MDKMKVISHILLLFDVKHMPFFFFFHQRGQLSNLDKLDQIAKVNTRRGLVMLLSLPFSVNLGLICRHYFVFANPLLGYSVTVTVTHTHAHTQDQPYRGYLGQDHILLLDCSEVH